MNEKKLVTFGCSFTDFSWPTWADWMGTSYPEYYNFGSGGSGNKFIFHKFMEALNNGLITKDTDVVIQWTSCLRYDLIPRGQKQYKGLGSVIHSGNYSTEFTSKYFNPYQQIIELVNYVKAIRLILDIKRINYTMFFMLNPWDGTLLGEPWNSGDHPFSKHELKKINRAQEQLKKALDGVFIDQSLSMYQVEHQNDSYFCWKGEDIPLDVEGHPAPITHYNYFIHKILPFFADLQSYVPDNTNKLREWEVWAKLRLGEKEKLTRKPIFPSDRTRNKQMEL